MALTPPVTLLVHDDSAALNSLCTTPAPIDAASGRKLTPRPRAEALLAANFDSWRTHESAEAA
jgi:hypothetical protein